MVLIDCHSSQSAHGGKPGVEGRVDGSQFALFFFSLPVGLTHVRPPRCHGLVVHLIFANSPVLVSSVPCGWPNTMDRGLTDWRSSSKLLGGRKDTPESGKSRSSFIFSHKPLFS